MAQPVKHFKQKGFTLIELLLAVVIIMVSMLALLSTMILSIKINRTNELRDVGIRITNQTAETLLALPFDDMQLMPNAVGSPHVRVDSDGTQDLDGFPKCTQIIRSGKQTYTIQWDVVAMTSSAVQATVTVSWNNGTTSNRAVIFKQAKP